MSEQKNTKVKVETEANDAQSQPASQTQPQSSKMETHAHHLHKAPGKKFWHYFFEFFMLFLAVFCGFLAENFREHQLERQREKQYVVSLIADLKNDQQIISRHMSDVSASLFMMDSLITLLNTPSQLLSRMGDLYYWGRLAPRLNPLSINSRTFEQLKNSGNFRLIQQLNTSDRIMSYYEMLPMEHLLESVNENEFTEYKKIAAKIFDPIVFLKSEGTKGEIIRSTDNPQLRITDHELLQELSVFAVYLRGTRNGILSNEEKLRKDGAELIEYLQKEYHLE